VLQALEVQQLGEGPPGDFDGIQNHIPDIPGVRMWDRVPEGSSPREEDPCLRSCILVSPPLGSGREPWLVGRG
jgi:hypothetical protein